MNKQSKIIFTTIVIIVIIGFGTFLLNNKERNIPITPTTNNQTNKECDQDSNCFLTSTNIGCAACDYVDQSWQCLTQEKSLEIKKEHQKLMNDPNGPSCAICMPYESPLLFKCICENGNCLKTSNCTNDNDCSAATLYTRGGTYKCIDNQCTYIDK